MMSTPFLRPIAIKGKAPENQGNNRAVAGETALTSPLPVHLQQFLDLSEVGGTTARTQAL